MRTFTKPIVELKQGKCTAKDVPTVDVYVFCVFKWVYNSALGA